MVNLGLDVISNVRIGKHVELMVEAENEEEAKVKVDEACTKLLANQIMEKFKFELQPLQQ